MKRRIFAVIIITIVAWAICACGSKEPNVTSGINNMESEIVKESESQPESSESMPENIESNKIELELKDYDTEAYGTITENLAEFKGNSDEELFFYYKMENFYVNDTFSNADLINSTLFQIYEECETLYKADSEVYNTPPEEEMGVPYDNWHFLKLTYVGDDYISILYNNVCYMGGAHPYSSFDSITIDCNTGEIVSPSELLEKSDEEILAQVSTEMGLDVIATWEDIDFYLTDSNIVFFYRMPSYWDDVVWERNPIAVLDSETISPNGKDVHATQYSTSELKSMKSAIEPYMIEYNIAVLGVDTENKLVTIELYEEKDAVYDLLDSLAEVDSNAVSVSVLDGILSVVPEVNPPVSSGGR